MPTIAVTRSISASMDRCELVHLERTPLDLELLRRQHDSYERVLVELGCELIRLPAADELPDSVFVEDTAVIFDDFAVITRPGAASRRPETSSVAAALERYLELFEIQAPGTLDGGDVLRIGRQIFVGMSSRSNADGIDQLEAIVRERGYELHRVGIRRCLHLKSAATWIGEERLLVNPEWVDVSVFDDLQLIEVAIGEPAAANAVRVGDVVIHGSAYPETRKRMEAMGIRVVPVDISEIAKAEGAVSCCSLLLNG